MNHPLPPLLTVPQFAKCINRCDEVVRRMIRRRKVKVYGIPYGIPNSELPKFGVSYEAAAAWLGGAT
jgi:hypothetical protein